MISDPSFLMDSINHQNRPETHRTSQSSVYTRGAAALVISITNFDGSRKSIELIAPPARNSSAPWVAKFLNDSYAPSKSYSGECETIDSFLRSFSQLTPLGYEIRGYGSQTERLPAKPAADTPTIEIKGYAIWYNNMTEVDVSINSGPAYDYSTRLFDNINTCREIAP